MFLLNDRTVEFHTQQGKHYNVRIPKFGRAMAYHQASCDLMLVGAGYVKFKSYIALYIIW